MSIDYLIVGAGFFGATCARLLHDAGYSVLVLEEQEYLGGHSATMVKDGIVMHKYGPHIFHTNNEEVWSFVNRFADFNDYQLKVKVNYKDTLYSFPINLLTINQVFGPTTPSQVWERIAADIPDWVHKSTDCNNFEVVALKKVGQKLYDIFFKGYTTKQWGTEPSKLPASIFNRLPIRSDYNDCYFLNHRSKHQGVPIEGYTKLIENMLDGIPVLTKVDYLEDKHNWNSKAKKVIYTGPIDALFDNVYGKLPYRSLRFEHKRLEMFDFQGGAVVNYTDVNVPHTRITEHKHFDKNKDHLPYTWISTEFPAKYEQTGVAFYPINDVLNDHLAKKYLETAKSHPYLIIGGRLGLYKYYDMDQTIEEAMKLCTNLIKSSQ